MMLVLSPSEYLARNVRSLQIERFEQDGLRGYMITMQMNKRTAVVEVFVDYRTVANLEEQGAKPGEAFDIAVAAVLSQNPNCQKMVGVPVSALSVYTPDLHNYKLKQTEWL